MTTEKGTERNADAVGTIAVNALKLSRGLKTTFEGIALVFDSLGAGSEFQESLSSAQGAPEAAPKRDSPNESAVREQPPKQTQSQGTQPTEPALAAPPEPAAPPDPAPAPASASSLTLDDITKVIVSKIKQDRSNNAKIEKLVQSFGVQSVKAIPPEKYEAFMTELAAV